MATIRPFQALRPVSEMAERVACVPYDVLDDREVNEYISANPLSFLRVTRPEAELAVQDRSHPVLAFERARQNLRKLIDEGIFVSEFEDCLYLYRLAVSGHQQTGIVACCSLDEYQSGIIRKHENVRPDKVKNRTGHLLTLRAQTGLILLAHRGTEAIHNLAADAAKSEPLYDFLDSDGVRHTIWRITKSEPWVDAFAKVPLLYIADGHHRIESADVARKRIAEADGNLPGGDEFNFVMAGIFPTEELQILAYNRVASDLNGLSVEEFLARIRENFIVSETDEKQPQNRGDFSMYLAGKWYKLHFAVNFFRAPDPVDALDVSILQDYILKPILGIEDPRTDTRIAFVGGKRGTAELERLIDEGKARVAFSLFPTTIEDLLIVSDRNEIMPPKSTWFEPKLKDGILVHLI